MRPSVLFVDDQKHVLDGLRRSLRGMRGKWEMSFTNGGQDALEHLALSPVDVVISDMRMPDMDGAELLAKVEELDPRIIRIILSGQVDKDSAIRLLDTSHQFLSKPCDPGTIVNTVERALSLRDLLADSAVQTLVAGQHALPTPPAIYDDLSRALRSPEPSLDDVARIVSQDPGLTVKVLQIASSGYFGPQCNITTPIEAVGRLGLVKIEGLVLSHGTIFESEALPDQHAWLDSLWNHSLACAGLAHAIAEEEGLPQKAVDNAFVAGLLHDVGTLVFATNHPKKYKDLATVQAYENSARLEAEQQVFGAIHAAVGAYLAGLWGLSDVVVEAIAYHHTPLDRPSCSFDVLSCVHVAEALTQALLGSRPGDLRTVIDFDYLRSLGIEDRLPKWGEIFETSIRDGRQP